MKIQQTTDALISNWTGMMPSTTLDLLPVRLAYSLSNFHFWYFLLSAIINANRRIDKISVRFDSDVARFRPILDFVIHGTATKTQSG